MGLTTSQFTDAQNDPNIQLAAYSTRGDSAYDQRFFNGADVDANDLVTLEYMT